MEICKLSVTLSHLLSQLLNVGAVDAAPEVILRLQNVAGHSPLSMARINQVNEQE